MSSDFAPSRTVRAACLIAVLAAVLGLAACKRSSGCSELGCFRRGVEVHVPPAVAKMTGARLVLSADGGSHTCPLPLESGDICAIGDRYPKQVKVQLWRGDALEREQAFELQYTTEYPNGKECPSKCDVAAVQVPW